MTLRSIFQKMDLSATGRVSANEFAAVVPTFQCGVRKDMLSAVFRLIEGSVDCLPGRLQSVDLIAKPKKVAEVRRRSCSRSKSIPPSQDGSCAVCGGVAPESVYSPPPSCGHWELTGGGWHVTCAGACLCCIHFPPGGKYDDKSLKAPRCGHWAFSTTFCGCRRPDGQWHRHICMVCIDFEPVTFTGMPTKGPAPSCGHWVWFGGSWISRGRYDRLMEDKKKQEGEDENKHLKEQVEQEVACNTTSCQAPRRSGGVITFSQFEQAYNRSA